MRAAAVLCLALAAPAAAAFPERLADTGIDAPGVVAFTPRYPLWSDGAEKRRWLYLPPGSAIDTSNPDAWEFPRGTRAWKEFRHAGRRIETRYIERLADGAWRYATYVWNAAGSEARLARAEGEPGPLYRIPSRGDCLACHEGAPVPILGYSAVQLHGELDPAPGYLHGNCGHCHNDAGPLAEVGLSLASRAAAPRESAARTAATALARREDLLRRVRSTNPYVRMPPLGVSVPDRAGIALIEKWLLRHQPPREIAP
jgi:hypothetical protein